MILAIVPRHAASLKLGVGRPQSVPPWNQNYSHAGRHAASLKLAPRGSFFLFFFFAQKKGWFKPCATLAPRGTAVLIWFFASATFSKRKENKTGMKMAQSNDDVLTWIFAIDNLLRHIDIAKQKLQKLRAGLEELLKEGCSRIDDSTEVRRGVSDATVGIMRHGNDVSPGEMSFRAGVSLFLIGLFLGVLCSKWSYCVHQFLDVPYCHVLKI